MDTIWAVCLGFTFKALSYVFKVFILATDQNVEKRTKILIFLKKKVELVDLNSTMRWLQ